MAEFIRRLAKLFSFNKEDDKTPEELEALRVEFQDRFESFKQLIASNRSSLEKMAEIEESLRGQLPLSINFARSRCASVAEGVHQMIERLDEISPNKYALLFEKFTDIERKIEPFFADEPLPNTLPLAVPLTSLDISASEQAGEKMATLGEIHRGLGLKIPDGFVITARAYWHFIRDTGLQKRIDKLLLEADPGRVNEVYDMGVEIRERIIGAELPDDLSDAIQTQYDQLHERLGAELPLAFRSSAQGEDMPGKSCAGMYRTLLGVSGDRIMDAYKEVVASKYETRAIIYRLRYGIADENVAMCVGCMPLVSARSGGVAYSRNPLDQGERHVMIHSVFGLPGPVSDGSARSDLLVVSRDRPMSIVSGQPARKKHRAIYDGSTGVVDVPLAAEEQDTVSISEQNALELARQVLMAEEYFGAPQDVEWALEEDGQIVFLQSRVLVLRERFQHGSVLPLAPTQGPLEELAAGEVTASQGAAAGPVHIVKQEMDTITFPPGGILVAKQPLPDWAMALKNVSAVVTEQGSMAGHLANVVRELHIPALFGVKNAVEKLEPGTIVTVDANRKKVFKGKVDALLDEGAQPQTQSVNNHPLYPALEETAKHILPLHLLNPDNPKKFTAEECSTFHDITRFCHEKAVREMFSFGRDHEFPERSAKRLHVAVPTQFWIIDLQDGFKQGCAKSRYVKLDDIDSIPMLALWYGMMSIPWNGPQVNARGFLEVLVESTANPGLNPSMPSPYAQRNYFMVTRKYCSCQTRFGYHFSTVEALVGERRHENFISFHFRGGAAKQQRRARRARLVGDIVQEHDFRVHVIRDSVRARLEKYDLDFMEQRMKVIGYLMFHTRQLDMVLDSNAAVERHKEKMRRDIAKLLRS